MPTAARIDLLTVRTLLDEALSGLRSVQDPGVERAAMAEKVARALQHVYRALARTGDYAAFRDECQLALDGSREVLATLQSLASSDAAVLTDSSLIEQAITALSGHIAVPADAALRLPRASGHSIRIPATVGEPRLVSLDRDVLQPGVPLGEIDDEDLEIPEVTVPDEEAAPAEHVNLDFLMREAQALAASMDEGAGFGDTVRTDAVPKMWVPRPPLPRAAVEDSLYVAEMTEEELVLSRARELFDDLSMMGAVLRAPQASEQWDQMEDIEDRLLARVDAILASGPSVLSRIVELVAERPVPDPELNWGAVFLFGSIDGDDAWDQALRFVAAVDLLDDDMFGVIVDALTFAPHPRVEPELRGWLDGSDVARRCAALDALGRRRALTTDEVLPHTDHPELAVVRSAAGALIGAQGPIEIGVLARLLRHEDDVVVRHAIEASMVRGEAAGLNRARELTAHGRGDFAQSAVYVGLTGAADDLAILRESAAANPCARLLEALGWYGHLSFVELVLGKMVELPGAAVGAMQRISGESLTKECPFPTYDEGDEPFVRATRRAQFDLGVSPDPEVWQKWWEAHRSRADEKLRHRWGRPFVLDDLRWEIEEGPFPVRERWLAYLQLVAQTGKTIPFDPREFVVRQRRQIEQWKASLVGRDARGRWTTRV